MKLTPGRSWSDVSGQSKDEKKERVRISQFVEDSGKASKEIGGSFLSTCPCVCAICVCVCVCV